MADDLTYCGTLVKRHDPDRFLISLMVPPACRAGLWALFAFNHEIARTREIVTDTTIGLIRLQWWRDALAEVYEGRAARQNEIVPELAQAIKAYQLPREWFEELLYAREFDLENVAPASLEGLENYALFTNAPLLRLALKVVGQAEEDAVLQAVAAGYGLVGLLRAVPFHARQQRCFMPADLMAAQGISDRTLYDMKPEKAFTTVTRAVGERASDLLRARPQSRFIRAHQRIGLLYLQQARRLGYDVFSARMTLPPAFFHLRFLFPLL